jgi:hypothetical protein
MARTNKNDAGKPFVMQKTDLIGEKSLFDRQKPIKYAFENLFVRQRAKICV